MTLIFDLGTPNFAHILLIVIVFIIIIQIWNIDWILKFLVNYIEFVTLLTPLFRYLKWLIEKKLAISQWKSAIHSKAMMLAYIFLVTARQKKWKGKFSLKFKERYQWKVRYTPYTLLSKAFGALYKWDFIL